MQIKVLCDTVKKRMKCQIRTRRMVKVYMVVCLRARSLIHSLGRVFNTLLLCACMYLVCLWMYVFTSFDASTMHNSHAVTAPARYIFCLLFSPVFPVLRWCVLLMIHARTHTLKMHSGICGYNEEKKTPPTQIVDSIYSMCVCYCGDLLLIGTTVH